MLKFGLVHFSSGLDPVVAELEVQSPRSWRDRERIAERKLAGAYGEQQQHHHRHHNPAQIEQTQMHGRQYQTEEPSCIPQVVTATPVSGPDRVSNLSNPRSSGITQGTGLSPDYTGYDYDNNPWAEEDRQRMSESSKPFHRDHHHAQDGHHGGDDQARRTSAPLTHLHGPHGTSGKDPRTMDKGKYLS